MHGQRSGSAAGGDGHWPPPPAQTPAPFLNANYLPNSNPYFQIPAPPAATQYHQNPNYPLQGPNFSIHASTFQLPTPNFVPNQFPSQGFQPHPPRPGESIERIDRAVTKARGDLLAAGESVSSWKVSQSALSILQAVSWESLGVQMQQVPSLRSLIMVEGKINAFIHCFVAVRSITSLYDLEVAICKNEGVEKFEEINLGPFVRHPLVLHYFSVSSDATEAFKITTEEIISCLVELFDAYQGKEKQIKVHEVLDFIAEKQSVSGKEKLNVRIQSLGMHIASIRKAWQLENGTLHKTAEYFKQKSNKKSRKRPLLSLQKKELDGRFNSISNRIKSFSSEREDLGGKHTIFVSSSSEDDDSDNVEDAVNKNDKCAQRHCNTLLQNTHSCDRVSSCPYPSAAEEMSRLGLKEEIDVNASPAINSVSYKHRNGRSKGKRKFENLSNNATASSKLPRKDKPELDVSMDSEEFSGHDEAGLLLSDDSMRMFIMTWKEACMVNDVAEVLERMLRVYKGTGRQRKRANILFSSYPWNALLNVAVTSIKCGMWDSMYDNFQAFAQHSDPNTLSEKCINYESIEVEPAEKETRSTTAHVSEPENSVTVDDIVKKVSTFFELDYNIFSNVKSPLEKKFAFLRKLCECESWLTEHFLVEKFESLGYGDFFMFLEKHVYELPNAVQKCLAGDTSEKSPLEVCMPQHQLAVLLSQASNGLGENESITKEMISVLLKRQFPPVSFVLLESGSSNDFMDSLRQSKSISTCVLFSATLFGKHIGNSESGKGLLKTAAMETVIGHKTGAFGSFTTKDATEVLLRAPMLLDLYSWTHWDLVFAPSLGPLVGWLLNEVNTKEMLCLVTKEGKVIRIDHTATVDSFLEASLQGSSFLTAVKLLSLLALYGGERHVPLSLLKIHARKAFEVFMKNSIEIEVNENKKFLMQDSLLCRQKFSNEDTRFHSDLGKCKRTTQNAVTVVSRFVIDCLGHLPTEFRAFAADVLLSGLQVVIKDAALAILGECKQIEQRLMLHDVGLSLGIMEWIDDHKSFCSLIATDSFVSLGASCLQAVSSEFSKRSTYLQDKVDKFPCSEEEMVVSVEVEQHNEESNRARSGLKKEEVSGGDFKQYLSEVEKENEATLVIESIRREEFGLDSRLSDTESIILKKQHARLGRALHCLSHELYSQDSHFILELVQNADDNVYPENVEATLTFILQDSGIVVLNNEQGFFPENIRALCDVGNSTKKGSSAGYIGKKGIGFKSVFRVTDAPEIHSNGFHVKFDISEGQIGFVLPTVISPCDIDYFVRLAACDEDKTCSYCWNTCIVLPFRPKLSEDSAMNSIKLMFSDLHPSLLLFLHRLQCIRFRNMLDKSLIIMRKEIVGNGIIRVSLGKEKMTWFVASQVLQADTFRPDVQTTEISIGFTLQELDNGDYLPHLDQQPVFAFLPLRRYGLKFIIQGDFVLPSSREEVDGDSPWNQWLLSKFPDLFVGAERDFCALPCFRDIPGKAVTAFMSFVPLLGEVHGFFSTLPRLIISKLRLSKCLLMEGNRKDWVLPCKVIRNWDEQAQSLLSDNLLQEHLGLGFLDKEIVLSDSLARDLGVEEYGPKILLQFISSLCHSENGLKSAGLVWLSSWLNAFYTMVFNSSGKISLKSGAATDVLDDLKNIPFIPLSDGTYSSVDEGTIWLYSNASSPELGNNHCPEAFPVLYAKLRTVSPALLSAAETAGTSFLDVSIMDNVIRMLQRIGVQQLSAHEIVKVHILPAICDNQITIGSKSLMVEYLSFVMFHLQSSCPTCHAERGHIISELHNKAFILTNYGCKRPAEVPIHFSNEFGNPIDVNKLTDGTDLKWHMVDVAYLNHPITGSVPGVMMKWREFLQAIGLTDFVHVVSVEKRVTDISDVALRNMLWTGDLMSHETVAKDWESPELVQLLCQLSSSRNCLGCKYLLEILDSLWDDQFHDKVTGHCVSNSLGDSITFKSSLISSLCGARWIMSNMDHELHYSKDLFYDCDAVRSILGDTAPYSVPKVKSEKFLCDIGFKTQVSLDDILTTIQVWRRSKPPFMASIAQMSKFYSFIWNEKATSKQRIVEELHRGPFIFIPYSCDSRHEDIVPGLFLSPSEVYWHDFTGSVKKIEEIHPHRGSSVIDHPLCKTLCCIYPNLHVFFVNECGVNEIPHFRNYLQILLQLSTVALPSQAAHTVFQVFLHWSDGYKSGSLSSEDVVYLQECLLKLEFRVLPTVLDKWVSLHPSLGLVCWCDDEKIRKEFKHVDNIDFLYFGELSDHEKELLQVKMSSLLHALGIPALSKVITREAIYYGLADPSFKASLLNWVLPYAQRYIHNVHHDRYFKLKHSGFENMRNLQIFVVEKLFCRNIIERYAIVSKKRFECSCLLQGNILYATRECDSHSLFMELSRLLFDGTPDLHLSNFLHMITTMAESGSNEEQTEYFILNNQKVPKLPDDEAVWYIPSLRSSREKYETLTSSASTVINQQNPMKNKRKHGINSSWPPVDWKTAPGFSFARAPGLQAQVSGPPSSSSLQLMEEDDSEDKIAQKYHVVPIEINADLTKEVDPSANTTPVMLPDSEALEDRGNLLSSDVDVAYDSVDVTVVAPSDNPNTGPSKSSGKDQPFEASNPQQVTGRLGELVAFNYFASNFGKTIVRWVNEYNESGLPYDIVIGEEESSREYIEVKATKFERKNWFSISVREWQFAVEQGESFSIAHVSLLGNMARITVFKNPPRLCQLGKLQLAVVMPKHQLEFCVS